MYDEVFWQHILNSEGGIMTTQNMCPYHKHTFVRWYGLGRNNPARNQLVATRETDGLDIPEQAHSFQFYEVYTAAVQVGSCSVLMKSDEMAFSPIYYCGGALFTVAEGERLFAMHDSVIFDTGDPMDDEWTLFDEIREGRHAGVTHVIRRRDGEIKPFRQGMDVLIPLK